MIILAMLGACSHSYHEAPVSDRVPPPSRKMDTHIVASGETLYSIAWRYDLDFSALARANGIGTDFRIYPGQELDLNVEARKPWAERQKSVRQASRTPDRHPPKAVRTIHEKNEVQRSKNQTAAPKIESTRLESVQSPAWQWPLKGQILSRFRDKGGLQKGIDIHGNLGDAVVAASAGVIVYSGDGLRGYGKLLILKHSDTYLSAYAHNRRLLVQEGDTVQAGQKIAEVGSTGTNSVKLYFEIRRDGKPVDPLHYLPKN